VTWFVPRGGEKQEYEMYYLERRDTMNKEASAASLQ